eukprot:m.104578 g.104578  ORF g.104578 m.104578 type:complete len:504 (+) comp37205_c0_seq9:598-2109(+)
MAAVLNEWMVVHSEDAGVFQLRSSLVGCGEKLLADKLFPLEGTEDEVVDALEVAVKPLSNSEEDVPKCLDDLREEEKFRVHNESTESVDALSERKEVSIYFEVEKRHIEAVANRMGDAWEVVARSLKPVVDELTLQSLGSRKDLSDKCKMKAVLSAWKDKYLQAATVLRLYQALLVNVERSAADKVLSLKEHQGQGRISEWFAFEEDDLDYDKEGDFLAAGRFCEVYRVTVANRVMAAKIAFYKQQRSGASDLIEREVRELKWEGIEREASLYLRIGDHPNIARFIGICRCPTFSALLLEHFSEDLYSLLSKNDPDAELFGNCLDIARQVARGMAHLHKMQVCRIDLKPANVLVRRRRGPFRFLCKICDFNLAVHGGMSEAELSQDRDSGTAGYTAREQLTSYCCNIEFLKKCDVWSFGMFLLDIVGKQKHGEYDRSFIVSHKYRLTGNVEYNTILGRCWAVNPQERPSFSEVQESLSFIIKANPDLVGLHGMCLSHFSQIVC